MTQQTKTRLTIDVLRKTLNRQSVDNLIDICKEYDQEALKKSLVSILIKHQDSLWVYLQEEFDNSDVDPVISKLIKRKNLISNSIDIHREQYKQKCLENKNLKLLSKENQRLGLETLYVAGQYDYVLFNYILIMTKLKKEYKEISDEIYFLKSQFKK